MPIIDFAQIVGENLVNDFYDQSDWMEWRYCYEAGRLFREEYLEQFSDRESKEDFLRRRNMTPIPAYAKMEVNRVKNALSQRFPDIIRRGGSKAWQEAVTGGGRGVDRRGTSMNSFLTKYIVPEALVMRKVGILVDAPRVNGETAADVPQNFRPYLNWYPVERIWTAPAPIESPSDWAAVRLTDVSYKIDITSGQKEKVRTFRYYWLDATRGNKVTIQRLDESGTEIEPPIFTNLDSIPFVVVDVLESLIRDVCSYQIAHLNMISADTAYAIDSNYPFMVRQRGNNSASHLIGDDDETQAGAKKGLFYDKGLDAPAFISPPSEPLKAALELRQEFKAEVRELVTGALASLGEDGSMEAGLAFIGKCLEDSEARLWDHWAAFESTDAQRRRVPDILYPEQWTLKTDMERLEEADKYLDIMNKLPGQKGKKEAAKAAYEKLYRGKLKTTDLDAIKAEVDAAPYTTSDIDIIFKAQEAGFVGPETGSLALGFGPDEWKKAEEAQARRAEAIVAAQADAAGAGVGGAARGNPDGSINPNSTKLARKGEADTSAKLGGGPGVRGEGEDTEDE